MQDNINTPTKICKGKIRRIFQKKRLALSKEDIKKWSNIICNNTVKTLLQKYENLSDIKIALYFPANNEVDTIYFIEEILQMHKNAKILMPKIQGDILVFNELINDSTIKENVKYKGIKEIDSDIYYTPDIIISPLVVFDSKRNRVGMGGGFYDRTIKALRKTNSIDFISLAYEMQKYDEIESEIHDEKPDIIITEDNTYLLRRK